MAELITVPTFTFKQGDFIKGDSIVEQPLSVDFYDGSICIRQDGEYDVPEQIIIHPEYIAAFFKEVLKHKKYADEFLAMRNK